MSASRRIYAQRPCTPEPTDERPSTPPMLRRSRVPPEALHEIVSPTDRLFAIEQENLHRVRAAGRAMDHERIDRNVARSLLGDFNAASANA